MISVIGKKSYLLKLKGTNIVIKEFYSEMELSKYLTKNLSRPKTDYYITIKHTYTLPH